jgi:hypothetical protein
MNFLLKKQNIVFVRGDGVNAASQPSRWSPKDTAAKRKDDEQGHRRAARAPSTKENIASCVCLSMRAQEGRCQKGLSPFCEKGNFIL